MKLVSPQAAPGARGTWRIVIEVRRIDLAVALSLLLHALLFALPGPRVPPPAPAGSAPMDVVLVTPPQAVQTPPEPAPEKPRPVERPVTRPVPRPPVVAAPTPVPETTPVPSPVPTPKEPPPLDMLASLEARRAARRAAEGPRTPPSTAPPAEDAATRNLRSLSGGEGVGGVFEILHKGPRSGEFAFNGWRPELRNKWRVVIEVDAGQGGDIELAMVRRMIQLIREYYSGDFKWESHRLQRVVTLSARPEDTSGLEDFMMKEFFESGVNPARR